MVDKAPTARALARETVRTAILDAARARLTEEGPAQLSLRAVARDVGMVSSAVYRYFPSRDDLLTALLVLDYDELGAAVEAAESPVDRADHVGRWVAACRAIRGWAVAHPGDFALLYGSPVPGYVAPQDTVAPASRTTHVLLRVVTDAWAAVPGSALPPDWRLGAGPSVDSRPGTAASVADAVRYAATHGFHADPAPEVVLRTLMAWTTVYGMLSFELFGHAVGSVSDHAAYFDEVVVRLAHDLGLASPHPVP
ncbi:MULTISPECIES: TetR/AcrR family transcriptional regulator [unclassified Curtobacterium]|uniref:TetR/AcrR family transcriptional regulator n=1 Tax=unclassified Curtobacterium TaxID=257496 RepID=UPI0008DE3271|nr:MULTISPECIES: TetR/AcrR family transcriptional regulator [unclassified Curtobacterium]WIA97544.1 TetR/AcrR family transcriptional regulator [Curtobacterium sp. MCBA15_004]WIB00864.1 TetR/AcrR family transcriptional regulator [Curtobacterium sp. MCBA15_012]